MVICISILSKVTIMKTNQIHSISKRTYFIAILIAILVASMLPLTGSAASSSNTRQAGFGISTINKNNNIDVNTKGMDGSTFHSKVNVVSVNTGVQQLSVTNMPKALAIPDLIDEEVIFEEATVEDVAVEEVTAQEVISANTVSSTPTFLSLASFAQQVSNGNSGQVTGIYSDNLIALAVVQQPSGQAGYVSTAGNTVTQFGMASGLGFLAHNYLSGSLFSYLYGGASVTVVYGDGHTREYRVSQIRKFQALSPDSPYSDFVDLASGSTLSATDLFYATYGVSGQLIMQTCISANGNSSWGRLFIIATPVG